MVSCTQTVDSELVLTETATSSVESESEDTSANSECYPIITFSKNELSFSGKSTSTPVTEGTICFFDEDCADTDIKEYSVSCIYGLIDKGIETRKNIVDNKFTYSITPNMELDIITIQFFRKSGYTSTFYINVTRQLNSKGEYIYVIQ